MDSHLMAESVDLLLYGVGVVFLFLILLVAATSVMSVLINRFFPEVLSEPEPGSPGNPAPVDALTLKIIQAALDKHRHRRQ